MSVSVNWSEFSVDVGWGVLRGKRCLLGPSESTPFLPVFCLHGWLDNANTYDQLVPLLPPRLEILVLDFPGHGYSDHFPPGSHYNIMAYVASVRAVVLQLGLPKFVLLAHSMGAIVANYYVALFPESVKALIQFDCIIPIVEDLGFMKDCRSDIRCILNYDGKNKKPPLAYSEEEVIARFVNSRKGGRAIDRDSAKTLLPRAVRKVDQGYIWRHDPKVQGLFLMMNGLDTWLYIIAHIKCPVLLVHAKSGVNVFEDSVYAVYLGTYKANAQTFNYVMVEGKHHVHLMHPSNVAPSIIEFLNSIITSTTYERSAKL